MFNSLSLISSFPGVWNHFDPHLFFDDNFGFNLYLGIEMQICNHPQLPPPTLCRGEVVRARLMWVLGPWPEHLPTPPRSWDWWGEQFPLLLQVLEEIVYSTQYQVCSVIGRVVCFSEFYREILSCLWTLLFFVLCHGVMMFGRKLRKLSREEKT